MCFGGWDRQSDTWKHAAKYASYAALCAQWLTTVQTHDVDGCRMRLLMAIQAFARTARLSDTHQLMLDVRSHWQSFHVEKQQYRAIGKQIRIGEAAREAVFPANWPVHGIWLVTCAKLAKCLDEVQLCVTLARKAARILAVTHPSCPVLRLAQQLEQECAMVLASRLSCSRRG